MAQSSPDEAEILDEYPHLVRKLGGRFPDAEDATHDALVKFLERVKLGEQFRNAPAWAGKAALSSALRGVQKRLPCNMDAVLASSVSQPDPLVEAEEADARSAILAALRAAITALPGQYREAVTCCDLEGRTRAEAAELAGVAPGTMSRRLEKAHGLLRGHLERHHSAALAHFFHLGCS